MRLTNTQKKENKMAQISKRNIKLSINGEIKNAKVFVTRDAANNYAKRNGMEIVYIKSHEYIVA